ncbi:MAG: pyruvate kinase [Anaerolineae bacterium]|nr:pyruvate kinase [Anaerolineae bacterium]NIN95830.1 pyruvate kinase [Anaerolineae bacterium]NIQ78796.1 pyruvate kinase [Anaerolineae bacterium]
MSNRRDKKTKIVCTIGPGSMNPDCMQKMYAAGMDAVRINTAHGDFDQYDQIIQMARAVGEIPIILDLKGPEVRIRTKHPLEVDDDDVIVAGFGDERLNFSYDFYDEVNVGDRIAIDDGTINTTVEKKTDGKLHLRVLDEGVIQRDKGVNIPGRRLNIAQLSRKDLRAIEYAREKEVEYLALSFTRNADDVANLRKKMGEDRQAIIAKIENEEGVNNVAEILEQADALMVARGGLGVEIEYQKVPLVQKDLIRRCNRRGKVVIIATQMLESMVDRPTPTRAETSDVANAILDGSDAVMLSEETAIGKYPVKSVEMMTKIALEAERVLKGQVEVNGFYNISETVSRSIDVIARSMPLDKIVTLTRSGYTARMIARFRPQQPIIAVASDEIVKRQLELVYGVIPVYARYHEADDIILNACEILVEGQLLEPDDYVLFTAGVRTETRHESNLIEIHRVSDLLKVANQR